VIPVVSISPRSLVVLAENAVEKSLELKKSGCAFKLMFFHLPSDVSYDSIWSFEILEIVVSVNPNSVSDPLLPSNPSASDKSFISDGIVGLFVSRL